VDYVGHIGGVTWAVAVEGYLVYVGEGPALTVPDVSAPASPTVLGRTAALPGIVRTVAVAGGYAYVAAGDAGLRVIDVSDPSTPVEVGFYDTPDEARGVAVAGGYAYIADLGLRVVDVSTPAAPVEVGFYDTAVYAYGLAAAGGYAYVADLDTDLRVVDVLVLATWAAPMAGTQMATELLTQPATGRRRTVPWEGKRSLFKLGLYRWQTTMTGTRPSHIHWRLTGWDAPNWQSEIYSHHARPACIFAPPGV